MMLSMSASTACKVPPTKPSSNVRPRKIGSLISADTDFATLLALQQEKKPSLILLRRVSHRPADQASLLLANLPQIEKWLEAGSMVTFDRARIRVRLLPLGSGE